MKLFKKIEQRVFICAQNGERTFLPNVQIPCVDMSCCGGRTGYIDLLDGTLPNELDTIFPQRLELVYQVVEEKDKPFDSTDSGLLITLRGFVVHYEPSGVLLVNAETGEPYIPDDIFRYSCISTERTIGGDA